MAALTRELRTGDNPLRSDPPDGQARIEGEEMSGTEIKGPNIAGVSKLYVGRWFKRIGNPVSIGEPWSESTPIV